MKNNLTPNPTQRHAGFTIVELLIVIVVIGILAAITIVAYNGVQQRSRDGRRDSDMHLLKTALEMYQADNATYPGVCAGGDNSGCDITFLATALNPYIKSIPTEPVSTRTQYQYVRGSSTTSYGILVKYEAKPVCKTGVNVATGWWSTSTPIC